MEEVTCRLRRSAISYAGRPGRTGDCHVYPGPNHAGARREHQHRVRVARFGGKVRPRWSRESTPLHWSLIPSHASWSILLDAKLKQV